MTRRAIWTRCAFDLVFLMLGSVLVMAEGFDEALQHDRIMLPDAPGPDGRLAEDVRSFVVSMDAGGVVTVDSTVVTLDGLRECASAARQGDKDEAVVLADAHAVVASLYGLLAELRRAGFVHIRIAVRPEENR
ncbi:MAG: hypothetical protein IPM29_04450 [Planctomycetes bacterium]|nr:hypothetical protein [Planctomycetota bacterium]